jgi:hypothetical protein
MFCDILWKAAHLWFNLMWTNHQYVQKYVGRIQNLCNSAESFARRKKLTGDCKISKSAQVPDLPFEESFWTKTRMLGRQMSLLSKINIKKVFWPPMDSGFCGLATQKTAKITQGLVKANLKDYWSKEIWPPSSKLIQIRSFGLTMTVEFVAWPPKTQSKAPRTGWRPSWRTIGPRNLASQFKRL